ncbi:hypothetical protein [Sphingomonas flavescens]|uniref:hypothetical protein n=1 Tax=Sphingomonas flavescens TaxID=3132797 RepID=UPI002805421D|nr:hypothetical protein [Sphingomonas limnosediminicola]
MKARLRWGAYWGDACILNISSQGMLIQTSRVAPEGSIVELHRGHHVILARIVWRDGLKAGLRTDDRLPVDQILAAGDQGPVQLVTSDGAIVERRTKARSEAGDAKNFGRKLEFVGACVLVLAFALIVGLAVFDVLATPIARIERALGNQAK